MSLQSWEDILPVISSKSGTHVPLLPNLHSRECFTQPRLFHSMHWGTLRPPLKQVLCSYQIYTLKHMFHHYWAHFLYVFPCDSIGKFPANQETQEDGPSCPRWGIFAGKGHGHPLQYSFLEHHGQRNLACYSPLHLKETDMSKVAEHACRKQLMCLWVFLVVQMVKTLPEMQETWVQFLSHGKITWRS